MFGDKLKQARLNAKITQSELAKILGTTNTTISNWENNVSKPDVDTVEYICGALNVSPNFFFQSEPNEYDDNIQSLLNNYNKLNDLGQHEVRKRAAELTELPRYLKAGQNNKIMTVGIDAYEMPASAGSGMFLSDEYKEVIQVKDCYEARTADFVVPISGDSMEPLYSDGDRVFVKSMPMVEVGEIGIFVINGDAYIKKRGRDRLISLNRKRKDIIFGEGDTIVCLGKVIGKVKD